MTKKKCTVVETKNIDAISPRKIKTEHVDPSVKRHCGFTKETAEKIAEHFRKDANIERAEAYRYTLASEKQEEAFENWCVGWREVKRRDGSDKRERSCADEKLTSTAQYECLLDKMKAGKKLTKKEIEKLEELSRTRV
jgi:hypothetical protein